MGGMVLETGMSEIITHVDAQNKLEKSESSAATTLRVGRGERGEGEREGGGEGEGVS